MDTSPPPGPAKPSIGSMPEVPRVVPFALFLGIGALAAGSFPGSEYWIYVAKTVVVGALLWWWRDRIREMRWAFSIEGVLVGVGIAVLWIGLTGVIPSLGHLWDLGRHLLMDKPMPPVKPVEAWNPVAHFVDQPWLGWGMVAVRVFGRSLVVPAMEEVFYRSFVYRYVVKPDFESVALGTRHVTAWLVTSALFGLSHPDHWLQGIVCGAAYQWLVIRKGRLGDAMLAHAVTNLLISGYAIGTGRWEFS